MTPKEKAEELVESFYKKIDYELTGSYFKKRLIAKQCALIAVDEIIKSNPIAFRIDNSIMSNKDYWQEVKQEIEKL